MVIHEFHEVFKIVKNVLKWALNFLRTVTSTSHLPSMLPNIWRLINRIILANWHWSADEKKSADEYFRDISLFSLCSIRDSNPVPNQTRVALLPNKVNEYMD